VQRFVPFAVILAVSTQAEAQQAPEQRELRGTIVDRTTGAPVTGATVAAGGIEVPDDLLAQIEKLCTT
jgi:hypothetical protein